MSALRSFGKWVWGALTAPADLFQLPHTAYARASVQQYEAAIAEGQRLDREARAAEGRAAAERLAAVMPKRDFRKTDTAPAQEWPDNAAESFGGEATPPTMDEHLRSGGKLEPGMVFRATAIGPTEPLETIASMVERLKERVRVPDHLLGLKRESDAADAVAYAWTARPGEGRKDDDKKARLDLIPPEVIMALGEILTFGAKKYSDRNWEKGMRWGRCYAAALRHMVYWWAGKGPTTQSFLFGSLDDETGKSHLWHALCCIAFLVAYEERGVGEDDRFTGSSAASGGARR